MLESLTRKQHELFHFLLQNQDRFTQPPTLDELCLALGLKSRGSLHAHITALIAANLLKPLAGKQRGIQLSDHAKTLINHQDDPGRLPYVGVIAAGKPIEALENISYMAIPEPLKTDKPCYILSVKGDSMIEQGIFDGDWVIIEQRAYARNGEIVVALVEKSEATLKVIEQYPHETLLIPANASMKALRYRPEQIEIQGVLVGQMRSYTKNH
ncbi:LexA repressor [Candidatus Methylobacter favarea]|uniref:LexA repressor n=1 Tax=Candidatus Methylobacter favarea TaxID=2707345 RepID=A0A8S0XFP0_9GAMM|nr:transcriptional repressor LexA [Candidatus Methylobacter favarea]CAA9890517.1 LexA repressor [Candidatus Methylobacter favarea]